MASTRFNYDTCRTIKKLQESTGPSRYILDTPGPGSHPSFMLDPSIIPQKWGANLYTNSTTLENKLLGIDRINTKCDHYVKKKQHCEQVSQPINYPVNNDVITESSRLVLPAFLFRSIPQLNTQYLPLDPQENVCIPFENNLSTRILEKDYFIRSNDYIKPLDNGNYLLASSNYNTQPNFSTGYNTLPFQELI